MSFFQPAPEGKTPLAKLRILSPKCGARVSPLQLGAMSIGEAWSGMLGSMDKKTSFELLDAFVEAGGNWIDTACNYQDEQSEQWIGEWMRARGNRDQMFIATKFTSDYRAYSLGKGQASAFSGNHKKSLFLSVRDSLAKLQTDYIDLLYLHWWDHTTSIEEVMDSLDIIVKSGKVLYLGISDAPAWVISAANTYANLTGKTPFVAIQARYNCILRDLERDIIPVARHFGCALALWDVMGGSRLQSQKQLEEKKKNNEKIRGIWGPPEQTEVEAKMSKLLEEIAQEVKVDSLQSVAIAYVMSKTPYVFPIIGGRKVEHLHQNIQALSIKLTQEQIDRIEKVQEFDLGFPHTMIGQSSEWTGKPSVMVAATANLEIVKGPVSLNHQ